MEIKAGDLFLDSGTGIRVVTALQGVWAIDWLILDGETLASEHPWTFENKKELETTLAKCQYKRIGNLYAAFARLEYVILNQE